jgi:hypothetical protein
VTSIGVGVGVDRVMLLYCDNVRPCSVQSRIDILQHKCSVGQSSTAIATVLLVKGVVVVVAVKREEGGVEEGGGVATVLVVTGLRGGGQGG